MFFLYGVFSLIIDNVCVALLLYCLYRVNVYVNYLSAAVSGIPNSAWPFLRTTKTHIFLIPLKLTFTMHLPNCGMIVLLYVLSIICLLMVFLRLASVTFLNSL